MVDPVITSSSLSADEPKSRGFFSAQEAFIPNIKVFGAGGAGGNVVTKMVDVGIREVEMVICNTDLKALQRNKADLKIELGKDMTRGLGAGARPEVGTNAAEETVGEIERALEGANMVFIAAGMGGGTGTGAAPVVARIAKARQILTVGVVTLPFSFEGKRRMQIALQGVEQLRQHTDTLLVIPNDKLQDASTQVTSLLEAFHMVDSILINAIQGITDLLNGVGDINVDFADVRTVMEDMGRAVIGRGTASGQDRLERAVHNAMHNSLLGNQDIRGAKGILVHVVGPTDTSAFEITDAMTQIEEMADEEVNLIWGATFAEGVSDQITVTIIATGLPD